MSVGKTEIDTLRWSAVLLDRDGVINRELGRPVLSADEFVFLPGALDALRRLAALSVPVVVVSNQSAIGRGWVARQAVDDIPASQAALMSRST